MAKSSGKVTIKKYANRRLVERAEQRQEERFNVAGHAEVRAIQGRAPVDEEHAPSHIGDRYRQGRLLVEVEDSRRVDERGDEDRRRALPAIVAQLGAPGLRDDRAVARRSGRRRILVSTETGKGRRGDVRLGFPDGPHQLEKQGQWPRGAFMLQCRMLR